LFNLEEDIDLEFIRDGDKTDAMDASRRIRDYDFPISDKLLDQLMEIAQSKRSRLWARIAAITTLGQMDQRARSVYVVDRILKDPTEDNELRECASRAISLFIRPSDDIQACSE
jgi:hypothetical protein